MMTHPRTFQAVLISFLVVMMCGACRQAANAPSNSPAAQNSTATPVSTQSGGIETETVAPQSIAGVIPATGKILVPEDRVAIIGPVNQGRIVRLYAGQGTRVRKGQKLADLESADIDQAEADYLKALADHENARRSSVAEVKLAQATYDRTKLLYEKTIVAGKNLRTAEHDLEVAKASAENMRRHVQELGLPHPGSRAATVVTVSIGVAWVEPGAGGSAAELVGTADRALYRAKEHGRNRVEDEEPAS